MADEEMGFGEEEFGGEGFGFGFEEAEPTATATPAAAAPPPAAAAVQEPADEAKSETPAVPSSASASASGGGANGMKLGHAEDVRSEKAGWLKVIEAKKTLSRRGPKERWFILSEGNLSYAASVRAQPIASFPLDTITHIAESSDQPESFSIVTNKKTVAVTARDESDAKLWIACIRKAQKSNTNASFGASATGNALLF